MPSLPAPSLSVSCVYYDTALNVFQQTLKSLLEALVAAKDGRIISSYQVHLINNNPDKEEDFLSVVDQYRHLFDDLILHLDQGNLGYGRGNNLSILMVKTDYHLILNPDVIQAADAVIEGIRYLQSNPQVGLLAPFVVNAKGDVEYLAKRKPNLLLLVLRAINSARLNQRFSRTLDRYAYKDKPFDVDQYEIEFASGSYMLAKTNILQKINGFSDRYFLYFEDFDLSLRMRDHAKLMFVRSVKIAHYGGYTSSKGIKHAARFFVSALKFLLLPRSK